VGLWILEARLRRAVQVQLERIHHVKHNDLVPAMTEKLERPKGRRLIEQKIGDEDHKTAPAQQINNPA
jgi:hypothetical protein